MGKEDYLERLEYYLKEKDFSKDEINEIMEDYELMIDEALEDDDNDQSLDERIGNPRDIVNQLKKTVVINRVKSNKLVAISPFIAMIVFFILGFGFDLWHPGWLAFLLIPITGILSSRRQSRINTYVEVIPFIALFIFLGIGLWLEVWHPTWVIFLLIPAVSILDSRQTYRYLSFVGFILIPIVYVLSYYYFPFSYNWMLFFLLFFPALYSGLINFRINGLRNRKLEIALGSILFLTSAIFVIIGVLTDVWHPTWLIFMVIPIGSIVISAIAMDNKIHWTAIMPFIAIIGFFLFGEFLDGYHWAWLFFLLIPMTAIVEK